MGVYEVWTLASKWLSKGEEVSLNEYREALLSNLKITCTVHSSYYITGQNHWNFKNKKISIGWVKAQTNKIQINRNLWSIHLRMFSVLPYSQL